MSNLSKSIFIITIFIVPSLVLGQNIDDQARVDMLNKAEECIEEYVRGLNLLGDPNERKWREDDRNTILKARFYSTDVLVYDDLVRTNPEEKAIPIRNYLENVSALYKEGVKFGYKLDLKPPCFEKVGEDKFYYIKAVVDKRLEGLLYTDNAQNINTETIDIYVRFPILQNYPVLKTGQARIYSIEQHQETICQQYEADTATISLTPFEEDILKERAVAFVQDYGLTLNLIGHPKINERYETTDYFEKDNTQVANDLLDRIILLTHFNANEYLNNIELWFQDGIRFNFKSVRSKYINRASDHVSVEVEVDRTIKVPVKGFRDKKKLSVFVKFPVGEDGTVGAERITPRISKIEAKAAKTNPVKYWATGGQINAFNYYGDLNPTTTTTSTNVALSRIGFSLHATKKVLTRLHLRLALSFGRIVGDDFNSADPTGESRFRFARNLHFRNNITELSAVAIYELVQNKGAYFRRRTITPYLMAGLAIMTHNPQARTPTELGSTWIDLHPLGTEGQGKPGYGKRYRLVQPVIPFGFGFKFRVNYRIDFALEMGFRWTFTDYLDDVSGNYADFGDLDTQIARSMADRSLEATASRTGDSRVASIANFTNQAHPDYINDVIDIVGSDDNTYTILNGYGRPQEIRGNPNNNDIYVVTGFHVYYFLKVGKERAERRRRRRSLDVLYDN